VQGGGEGGEGPGDLARGTRLELPLWLSEALAPRGYVRVDLPRAFNLATRQALMADARVVRLGEKSPMYYELAARLSAVSTHREVQFISAVARAAFADRCNMILDRASAPDTRDQFEWAQTLTLLETELLQRNAEQANERRAWRLRKTEFIRPAAARDAGDPWDGAGTGSGLSSFVVKRPRK
jgi:GINS complex protein